MSKGKEKIIGFLNERINILRKMIQKEYDLSCRIDFDLWDKTTRRILRKTFGADALNEYLECLKYEPTPLELGHSDVGWRLHQFAKAQDPKIEIEEEGYKFLVRTSKIINFLKALKKEVRFFDDKDIEKYTKEIRKWWSLRGKTPFLEAEYGKEEKTK